MITVLMEHTSLRFETDPPNAYHITELPECSDSMIEYLLTVLVSVCPVFPCALRSSSWGMRASVGEPDREPHPAVCLQADSPRASIGRTPSNNTRPRISKEECLRPRGNVALWVLYLLLREVCAISRI
jgi:hypothetical protein